MKKKSRLRRSGRGTVLLISVMLFLSALLRLGPGAGGAIAEAVQPGEASEPVPLLSEESLTKHDDAPLNRTEVGGLLDALQAREARVKTLEKQIEIRAKALAVADEEITKRLAALEEAEMNLRRTLSLADGAAEDDLARLTTVYENMKPKDAAALFAAMEPDFAAGFLGRMRPDAAAAVMTGLPPEVAYSISVILAGRNANAPKT